MKDADILSAFIERETSKPGLDLEKILFGPQLAFVKDPARLKCGLTSRRAGKTVGCVVELLDAYLRKNAPVLYFSKTRAQAKRNIWATLKAYNRRYNLGLEPNESELVFKKDGEGVIFLTGADNRGEVEKWRGTAWGKVIGDEAQSFPDFLRDAVADVLLPSFLDHDGTITLIGTPSPVPVGYFFDCTQDPAWSRHSWTFWDNPFLKNKKRFFEDILRLRRVTETDPSIRREFFGQWQLDLEALVFKFDRTRNVYTELPSLPFEYVVGVDLGWKDADAISVLAFSRDASPNVYLVEEQLASKQTITGLMERLAKVIDRYKPISVVADAGGLGLKIVQELNMRFALPIKAAEKSQKQSYIALVNDALRQERLFVKADSRFAHDSMLLEWDWDKSKPDKLVVSERFHSDALDSFLYGFRESLHFLHVPALPAPKPGTEDYFRKLEEELEERVVAQLELEKKEQEEFDYL